MARRGQGPQGARVTFWGEAVIHPFGMSWLLSWGQSFLPFPSPRFSSVLLPCPLACVSCAFFSVLSYPVSLPRPLAGALSIPGHFCLLPSVSLLLVSLFRLSLLLTFSFIPSGAFHVFLSRLLFASFYFSLCFFLPSLFLPFGSILTFRPHYLLFLTSATFEVVLKQNLCGNPWSWWLLPAPELPRRRALIEPGEASRGPGLGAGEGRLLWAILAAGPGTDLTSQPRDAH